LEVLLDRRNIQNSDTTKVRNFEESLELLRR